MSTKHEPHKQPDIALAAKGLTAYAVERQIGKERRQADGAPLWSEQRRIWIDAILQGMAELNGRAPDPQLMERYDRELELARSGCETVPVSFLLQRKTIRILRDYVSALETAGGDQRQQIDIISKLLEDMWFRRPWLQIRTSLVSAHNEAERALRRMTAQMPICFTHILLGGDDGPHRGSSFVSGSVTNIEAVKQTGLYQEMVRLYPEVISWPALCAVYVGQDLRSTSEAANASDFDLNIMNHAGSRFLNERGVRWMKVLYQMTITTGLEEPVPMDLKEGKP